MWPHIRQAAVSPTRCGQILAKVAYIWLRCWNEFGAMKAVWIALAAPLLLSAAAASSPGGCANGQDDSRCGWHQAGAADLATVAARGSETMRFWGGQALAPQDAFMAEFVRDSHGAVRLTLRDPDRPSNAVSRPVPASVWAPFAALRARTIAGELVKERHDAAQRAAEHRRGEDYMVVCTDAGGLTIDTVLKGRAEHFESGGCPSAAVYRALARLPGMIYRLMPDCLRLGRNFRSFCASMSGDRRVAAAAAQNVILFADLYCTPAVAKDMLAMIAPDATIEIAGQAGGPVTKLMPELCVKEQFFYPLHLEANGTAITVTGTMRAQWYTKPSDGNRALFLTASGTQLWRIDGGAARLEKWTIGRFARSD